MNERMYGPPEFQIAAESHGHVIQPSEEGADGHQIRECLSGVLVAAVAGVDHRDGGVKGSH